MSRHDEHAGRGTEVWEIINLTADTHPIHSHLFQFQLLDRQSPSTDKNYLGRSTACRG